MKTPAARAALRIALLYLLFAGMWIVFSDRFLALLVSDPFEMMWWSIFKGLGFVLVTTLLLFTVLFRELIKRQRADTRTQDRLVMLQALYAGARQLSESLDIPSLVESITRGCVEHFGARLAWLGQADADGAVRPIAKFPADNQYLRQLEVRWDESPAGQGPTGCAIRRGEPVVSTDISIDPRMAPWRTVVLSEGICTSAAFPLPGHDKIIGAFSVYSDQPGFFTPERVEFFQAYARQAGAAMEHARLYAQLRAIFETEPEGVELVAADGTLIQMNAAGLAMLEADDATQVIGHEIDRHIAPEYRDTFHAFHASVIRGERGSLEFEVIGLKKTRRWLETHATPMADSDGAIVMLGITRDVSERKRSEARLNYLANYDPLTGLPNRILFNDRLQQAMIDATRHERLVGVVFLDLDRFKHINDTLGHEQGDMIIKAVGERLIGAVRRGDTVARLSGDEFTIVLADMAHVDDAARVAQKILEAFSRPFNLDGRELNITASLGVTLYPFDDKDIQGLLRNADVAMYRAKDSGRNSYQFYAAEMTHKAAEFLALDNDLRHVLERHELYLDYQPVLDCHTGRITGVEALLRWRHPLRGLILPTQFIPLAEETGQIVPIGEWVLRTACAQCQAWHNSGFPPVSVSVNLSARQFHQLQLATVVEKTLHETGLNPTFLELEITESIIMQHADITVTTLNRLKSTGLRFSIDDFGTGYSSLSYLKRFPIDALKIDQSFVRDITTDPDDSAIAQAIITLAHTLGIRVIAEGVETPEQFAFLRAHGCDAMQGYYFSRPVAPEEIVRMLRTGKCLEFNS